MSTFRHTTDQQPLSRFTSNRDWFSFDNGDTEVSLHVSEYVHNEGDTDRDFARVALHIDPTDQPTQPTRIEASSFEDDIKPFWALNIGPVSIYLTPEDRRRIITALVDGGAA